MAKLIRFRPIHLYYILLVNNQSFDPTLLSFGIKIIKINLYTDIHNRLFDLQAL